MNPMKHCEISKSLEKHSSLNNERKVCRSIRFGSAATLILVGQLLVCLFSNSAAFGQIKNKQLDLYEFVQEAIPISEIKGEVKEKSKPLRPLQLGDRVAANQSVVLRHKNKKPQWLYPGHFSKTRTSDFGYIVTLNASVFQSSSACQQHVQKFFTTRSKLKSTKITRYSAGDFAYTAFAALKGNDIEVHAESIVAYKNYLLEVRVSNRNPAFVGEKFDQYKFTTSESKRLVLIALSALKKKIEVQKPFVVKLFLEDKDDQFTIADLAKLTVEFQNQSRLPITDCEIRCSPAGEFLHKTDPVLFFPNQVNPVSSLTRLDQVAVNGTRKSNLAIRSAAIGSKETATDFAKQWHLDRKTWTFQKLVNAPRPEVKPPTENGVLLQNAIRVQVFGRQGTNAQRKQLYDANHSIFLRSTRNSSRQLSIVRLQFPDLRKTVGRPAGDQRALEYYMNGDPRESYVGDRTIRALAIRAARYGKSWNTIKGSSKDPDFPDDPETIVRNIAEFVTLALQPKGAPADMWAPVSNAKDLWRRELGFGKKLPDRKIAGGAATYVCQEHAYLFGSMVRSLGLPARDINVLTYNLYFFSDWQDASTEVWYGGAWNYWGLFDIKSTGSPKPFRDPHEWYGKTQSYLVFRGMAPFDADKANVTSRFNIGEDSIRSNSGNLVRSGVWKRYEKFELHNGRLIPPDKRMVQINIHSPVVALVTLPDGKRFGVTEKPVGNPDAWFFGEQRGLINEIPGAVYMPEGMSRTFGDPAKVNQDRLSKHQRILIPVGKSVEVSQIKLRLTAVDNGAYKIDLRDATTQSVQHYKSRSGKVARGEELNWTLEKFEVDGVRRGLPDFLKPLPSINRKANRAWLGIGTHSIDPLIAKSLKFSPGKGVVISHIDSRSPAAKSQLKNFDVVTSINGQKVVSQDDVKKAVSASRPGEKINLDVQRLGRISLTLGERPTGKISKRGQETHVVKSLDKVKLGIYKKWNDGFRLKNMAAKNDQLLFALSTERPFDLQSAFVYREFTNLQKTFKAHQDAGWILQDVSGDESGNLYAVYCKRWPYTVQDLARYSSRKQLHEGIKSMWKKGYNVSSVATSGEHWIVVYARNKSSEKQSYISYTGWEKVKEGIRTKWKDGKKITAVARSGDRWLVVFSSRDSIQQRWVYASDSSIHQRIAKHQEDGYFATELVAGTGSSWFVVLEKTK